jgi:hypothetical protein
MTRVYVIKLKLMYIKIMLRVKIVCIKSFVLLILGIVLCYVEHVHFEQYNARGCAVISESKYYVDACYVSYYDLIFKFKLHVILKLICNYLHKDKYIQRLVRYS